MNVSKIFNGDGKLDYPGPRSGEKNATQVIGSYAEVIKATGFERLFLAVERTVEWDSHFHLEATSYAAKAVLREPLTDADTLPSRLGPGLMFGDTVIQLREAFRKRYAELCGDWPALGKTYSLLGLHFVNPAQEGIYISWGLSFDAKMLTVNTTVGRKFSSNLEDVINERLPKVVDIFNQLAPGNSIEQNVMAEVAVRAYLNDMTKPRYRARR